MNHANRLLITCIMEFGSSFDEFDSLTEEDKVGEIPILNLSFFFVKIYMYLITSTRIYIYKYLIYKHKYLNLQVLDVPDERVGKINNDYNVFFFQWSIVVKFFYTFRMFDNSYRASKKFADVPNRLVWFCSPLEDGIK